MSLEKLSSPGPSAPVPAKHRSELHIPLTTLLKVIAVGLGSWVVYKLWDGFLLFLISLLGAVTLHPVVEWMERRRIPRSVAVMLIACAIAAIVTGLGMFIMPPLTDQLGNLLQDYPNFRIKVLRLLPSDPYLQRTVGQMLKMPTSPAVLTLLSHSLVWGQVALLTLVGAAIVVILTLYLLLDGKSMYAWLLAFVPRGNREKMAKTVEEVSQVVHAYVSGQVLAVILFTIYCVVVLTILEVPAVAPLAVMAGLCDVIPVLGIMLATAPALLLALTVSPMTAVAVLIAYFGYHFFETYFLLPRIYGSKLRLSTLSVLLALMVGVTLQGIIGAIVVLPLVAAYPIIERIWLAAYLQPRVLKDHTELAKAAEAGSEEAIATVLQGEKHASEDLSRGKTEPHLLIKKS